MEFLRICRSANFMQVVASIKSSNTRVMVAAYRLLAQSMEREALTYPLHLGVTEAGNGMEGRIKSAVGIGALLSEGLGDTVRVSLTEPPENEIPVAQKLIAVAPQFPYTPSTAPEHTQLLIRHYRVDSLDDLLMYAACDAGHLLIDNRASDFKLAATVAGQAIPDEQADDIALALLQAARVRFTKPEYIACPGCGRTLFDLQKTLNAVRAATSHLVGAKIAVMGCIVNGPGEMADADYGYVGAGVGKITLYKGKQPVKKGIPEENAVDELLKLINADR
jgi:(E)-4-hydroxy-3-methylbut-2-enyl-diphosphate synthase